MLICSNKYPVYVRLNNYGTKTITQASISWKVNNIPQKNYIFSGILNINRDTLIRLGFISPNTSLSKEEIWVKTFKPNKSIDSNASNDSAVLFKNKGLIGKYDVGLGTKSDFNFLDDAINQLQNRGVCGNIILNIADGTYQSQIVLSPIVGLGGQNTLTIQSKSLDSSKVIFNYPTSSVYLNGNNYLVQLNNTSNIIFNKMTFSRSGGGYYSNIIEINGRTDGLNVKNCVIKNILVPAANPGNYFDANNILLGQDAIITNSVFNNNYFYGSNNCFAWNNHINKALPKSGNIISDNFIDSSFLNAIIVNTESSISINNNNINSVLSYSDAKGISLSNTYNNITISKNKILLPFGGTGINLQNCSGTKVGKINLYDNFISVIGSGSGNNFGISSNSVDSINISFNNLYLEVPSINAGCIKVGGTSEVYVQNNNLFSKSKAPAYLVSSLSIRSDYNNIYAPSSPSLINSLGFTYNSLTGWISASGKDFNSLSVNPLYKSLSDLHISNPILNGAGKSNSVVTVDIDNQKQSSPPDIGADEFQPLDLDVALISIDSPYIGFCNSTKDIYVRLRNAGLNTLKSATINWVINGKKQPTAYFSGTLTKGNEQLLNIGSYSFSTGVTYKCKITVSSPNGFTDSAYYNDTVSRIIKTGLKGSYTISPTSTGSTNYTSYTEAVEDLINSGVCGTTNFIVDDGSYAEQFVIPFINGSSYSNQITFQSKTLDSSACTLDYPSKYSINDNYVIKLKGAQYINFSHLGFSRTGLKSASNVIDYSENCQHITFKNCYFEGPILNHKNAYNYFNTGMLIYSYGGADDSIQFINSYFTGNYWPFFIYGNSSSQRETHFLLQNNIINTSFGGGQFVYHNDINITGNQFKNINGYQNGLYFESISGKSTINNNIVQLTHPLSGTAFYGYYLNGKLNSPFRIYNNMLTTIGNYGYGISLNFCDSIGLYFNTIASNASGSFYPVGYFLNYYSSTPHNKSYNNIFISNSDGDVILESNFNVECNNNIYFTIGNFGYYNNSAYTTFSDWKSATGFDSKSFFTNPQLLGKLDLHCSNFSVANNKGVPIINIKTDIDGNKRNVLTPDIGADEFTPINDDIAVDQVVALKDGQCGDSNTYIYVNVKNAGNNDKSDFSINCEYRNTIVSGKIKYIFTNKDTLKSGSEKIINLGKINTYKGGTFELIIYSDLYNDKNRLNDSIKVVNQFAEHIVAPNSIVYNDCYSLTTKLFSSKNRLFTSYWTDSNHQFISKSDTLILKPKNPLKILSYLDADRSSAGLRNIKQGVNYSKSSTFSQGLIFAANNDFYLDSIKIYPEASGDVIINIYDSVSNLYTSKSFKVYPTNPFDSVILPLKIFIKRSSYYFINADGSTCKSLLRTGSTIKKGNVFYPYKDKDSNYISIYDNSSSSTTDYYFFYDWKISNHLVCPSNAVRLSVNPFVNYASKRPTLTFQNKPFCAGTKSEFYGKSNINNKINYHINFGDSSVVLNTSKIDTIKHIYGKPNTYRAILFSTLDSGCTDSVSSKINILSGAVAGFKVLGRCEGTDIELKDSSTSAILINTYDWDFGDGTYGKGKDIKHQYNTNGIFKTILTVTTSTGCVSSYPKNIKIIQKPIIKTYYSSLCDWKNGLYFNDSSLAGIGTLTKYYWLFEPKNKLDSNQNTSYKFKNQGIYNIIHTVKNSYGCVDTQKLTLNLNSKLNANFIVHVNRYKVDFVASDTTFSLYIWNYNDSTLFDVGSSYKSTHVFKSLGAKKITLNVVSKDGCSVTYDSTIALFNTSSQIVDNNFELDIKIFPNPTNGTFKLIANDDLEYYNISINNVSGQIVQNITCTNRYQIEFGEDLIPGFYFAQIFDKEKRLLKTIKLIKINNY